MRGTYPPVGEFDLKSRNGHIIVSCDPAYWSTLPEKGLLQARYFNRSEIVLNAYFGKKRHYINIFSGR